MYMKFIFAVQQLCREHIYHFNQEQLHLINLQLAVAMHRMVMAVVGIWPDSKDLKPHTSWGAQRS